MPFISYDFDESETCDTITIKKREKAVSTGEGKGAIG
jgi:hypothetical protein